jgi:hypothetical protein
MTPAQERALLDATSKGLDDQLRDAFAKAQQLMREGVPPRDAITQVMESFSGEYATLLSEGFSAVLSASVGTAAALEIKVGSVSLSRRLYAESQSVSTVVQGIVDRHAKGFQDSRRLALELFEGYSFRSPEAEPLQISRTNPVLPKYLREELLTDPQLSQQLNRVFTRLQAEKVITPALRSAYLDAINALEQGLGEDVLAKKMEVAFFEKTRFFANRIAQTELHRAYSQREAQLLTDDPDVEFVQVRRSSRSGDPCICSLITGRDLYGLGAGVYPKKLAPVPTFHPFCRCVISPRLDIKPGKKWEQREDADSYFLRKVGQPIAGRIMGSQAKAEMVLMGNDALKTYANKAPPDYQVSTIGQVVSSG